MDARNLWPFDDDGSIHRFSDLTQKLKEANDGGVAFFGAGASADAGFPTWADFHKQFLAYFGAEPASKATDPARALLTDIDYHSNRDQAKALTFVKNVFASPVSQRPQVVDLALRTRSFRYFYTTNFDEILFDAAGGKEVSAYPDYKPMGAQFVYLHGRASTAGSVSNDLVLGRTGYDQAYSEEMGALVRGKLQLLAPYPVVFIGFSMDDPYVARSLERISQAARRRQETVEGDAWETVSPLNWYILLKAPVQKEPGRDERKRLREAGLRNSGVEVIWYQDGGALDQHRGVLELVQRIQREGRGLTVAEEEPGFVERLIEAEELASVTSPTPSDVRRAEAILRGDPGLVKAFLDRVDGLEWFRQLRDVGALDPAPSFVTPKGERRAPHWRSVGLLQRVASIAPSEVADFLRGLKMESWIAVLEAFDILEALDEPSGATLGEQFAKWAVSAMSVDPMLLDRLSRTARKLESDGKYEAALALVRAALLELANVPQTFSEWNAAEFSQGVVPTLARSESGSETLIGTLRTALEHRCETPDQDDVRDTRPAIEAHQMNLSERPALGLLIDVTRDTLFATELAEWRKSAVTRLIQSPWPTERRIAIAHCFLQRRDLPEHEASIVSHANLADRDLFHELAKLIAAGVEDLSKSSSQIILDCMQSLHGSPKVGDRTLYQRWAAILPAHLLPAPKPPGDGYDDHPERRLFGDFYSFPTFSATSPLDGPSFANRAATLSPSELLALVRDPAAEGVKVTWRHSTEDMWSLLADYAKKQDALNYLLEISSDDLSRRSIGRAIEAMPEVAGNDPGRWREVLDWADRMMSVAPPGEFWSLGQLVESSGISAPLEVSERVRALALQVIVKTKRTSAVSWDEIRESLGGGFWNQPAGHAVQALLELLQREMVESEAAPETPAEIPQWFKETVLEPMARDPMELGIDAWIGLGRVYGLLSARAPDAVAFVASHLQSQPSERPITAAAFWVGYLWVPSVSSDALKSLREAYRTSAPFLQKEGIREDLMDLFFQHLVIGALREIPGYDEILLATLGQDFTPAIRGSIAFALGCGVREFAAEPGTLFHTRATEWFLRYWTKHVEEIGGQDGDQLAKYLRWLSDLDLPLGQIRNLLEASLGQAEDRFGVRKVLEYLTRHVEENPEVTLKLLDRCVEWYRLHGDAWADSEQVRALLDRLAPLTLGDRTLREVLDGFTELGVTSTDDVHRYLSGGPT